MQAFSFLGLPWWTWLALVAIFVWIVVMQLRMTLGKATHRAEQERLAQAADAMHEGAKTRHERGA